MLIAGDVCEQAKAVRDHPGQHPQEFQALQGAVDAWSRQMFWDQDEDTRTKVLTAALATNADLRRQLAQALQWDQPADTSAELILLAINAIKSDNDQNFGEIFGAALDWQHWKINPDLDALQTVLEQHVAIRNGLARRVQGYPGNCRLREIAEMASQRMQGPAPGGPGNPHPDQVCDIVKRHVLNWEEFSAGHQDLQLQAAVCDEYEFRAQVARALNVPGTEAVELAGFAVEMWRGVPVRWRWVPVRWHKRTRSSLLEKLPPQVRQILANTAAQEPDEQTWISVQQSLAILFAREPQCSVELWNNLEWPQPFSLVLREELRQIEARRRLGEPQEAQLANSAPDASDLAVQKGLFGVAFSGGGIRSATFNLGVLEKLSGSGLLPKIDYLSTVSGGGYIGAWLGAWISKNAAPDFPTFLAELRNLLSPKIRNPRAETQRPIQFLREFSNYLTPRLGSFSFDTWTMAAVYSRNLVLNQTTLIAVLGTLLLIPRFLVLPLKLQVYDSWMWILATALLSVAVFFMSLNIRDAVVPPPEEPSGFKEWVTGHVQILVITPVLLAMYFGSLWTWRNEGFMDTHVRSVSIFAFTFAAGLSFLLSTQGGFIDQFRKRQVHREWWPAVLAMITLLSAGATTALLRLDVIATRQLRSMNHSGVWHAEIWSPVMLLTVLVIPGALQVGLMGVDFPDAGREWLSRFRAVCSVYTTWWIAFMCAAIYGPYLVMTVSGWTIKGIRVWISGLTLTWVGTTIGGLIAGSSNKTGTDKEGKPKFSWRQLLATIAPPVFAVGIILLLTSLEQLLLAHGRTASYSIDALKQHYWEILQPWPFWSFSGWYLDRAVPLFLVLLFAGAILAWRVDINEFSMHHFYKNRLVRCYLGASNEKRRPDGFTGFDARDDLKLAQLKAIPDPDETAYRGPYPILNATLNLSMGEQLAWQERKGTSFILSPCYCGFDVQGWASSTAARPKPPGARRQSEKLQPAGYRRTREYTRKGGPLLGTSVSISGAAANPNQGYNTSPAVAFLMTMFDVRLGWWIGNPRRNDTWKSAGPGIGLLSLVSELLGMTDDRSGYVNLSDGGHFDNMGLYELVRRRCGLILLCDAEQDPDYKFEGLGSAIRKCRVDFGVHIEIDPTLIKPKTNGTPSGTHCAVGRIRYLDGTEGTLVYIKPSMTGDEPEDVTQYHMAHSEFPHETTADQWFGESQFESYRALGYHATDRSLTPATAWVMKWDSERPNVPSLFDALKDYWYPVNPNLKDTASKNTATLSGLLDQIRQTAELHALGAKLFPGITVPSTGNQAATQKFYFSLCIIQLVEDLFFDLQLDRKEWRDDPRIGGWRQLFKTWKHVPDVGAAWAAEQNTFRKDFQVFWNSL